MRYAPSVHQKHPPPITRSSVLAPAAEPAPADLVSAADAGGEAKKRDMARAARIVVGFSFMAGYESERSSRWVREKELNCATSVYVHRSKALSKDWFQLFSSCVV